MARKTTTTGPARAGAAKLSLHVHAERGAEYARFIRTHLRRAHALMRPPLHELSLALLGDARMSALHQRFMGIAGPTDVLTFELEHDARGRVTAGEVVVCVPVARRQAAERGSEPRMELLLYALHGMLHLCGFDDRTDRGFRTMHRREDDILTALGFAPVFAASRSPAPARSPETGRRATAAPATGGSRRRALGRRSMGAPGKP